MLIKIHVLRRGMWRKVYFADGWTFAAHLLIGLLLAIGLTFIWR